MQVWNMNEVWQPYPSPAGAAGALRWGAGPAEFSVAHQRGCDTVGHPPDGGSGFRVSPAGLACLPAETDRDPNSIQQCGQQTETDGTKVSAGRWMAKNTGEESESQGWTSV